jgi:hypothetical protein
MMPATAEEKMEMRAIFLAMTVVNGPKDVFI